MDPKMDRSIGRYFHLRIFLYPITCYSYSSSTGRFSSLYNERLTVSYNDASDIRMFLQETYWLRLPKRLQWLKNVPRDYLQITSKNNK